jgi:transcriptional/translational regulatory protein YebC/TACO1
MEDLEADGDTFTAWCDPSDVIRICAPRSRRRAHGPESGSTMVPARPCRSTDGGGEEGPALLDLLDDNDDVQDVYANFDIPDDVLEAASEE